MNPFWITILIILALIYIISPIDGLPDMVPILGWLDDTFLMGLLIYYLRYRRLPGFLLKFGQMFFKDSGQMNGNSGQSSATNENSKTSREETTADSRTPWQILGVSKNASQTEIHHAYRKLVQQYHPDKVAHLGEEFQELAKKKFIQIQEAYHILTRQ